jgi:phosphonate transport system substrate-binding protein
MIINNIRASLVVLILACFTSFSYAADDQTYVFSVVPQFKPAQLHKEWGPILARVSRETGIKLKLDIPSSIPKFEAELSKGLPDFAFMNPYEAVLGYKEHGYIPLIRNKKQLSGIVVVRKDSPYKTLSDLNNKEIGFPSPNAFGASLYIRARLSEDNPIKFTAKYLNNHNLVFKHVLLGHVAAGGTVNSALNDEDQATRDQLTILYQTPGVAPHPIGANPRVPEQVRKAVINAILNMQQDAEGRAMLDDIRMPELTDANYKNDYQPLEKLNLNKYYVEEN